ncbi:MAG: hypothetical protein HYW24_00025 [Candidatus Aenigmarchaeota archaeon]|nr:hypothetical protein [Candidatus Aenigmarchaeota archaeon]
MNFTKEEILVYVLWIVFLVSNFILYKTTFGILAVVSVILAIWVSNRIKDKKKSKILSWISFFLLLVGLAPMIIGLISGIGLVI